MAAFWSDGGAALRYLVVRALPRRSRRQLPGRVHERGGGGGPMELALLRLQARPHIGVRTQPGAGDRKLAPLRFAISRPMLISGGIGGTAATVGRRAGLRCGNRSASRRNAALRGVARGGWAGEATRREWWWPTQHAVGGGGEEARDGQGERGDVRGNRPPGRRVRARAVRLRGL